MTASGALARVDGRVPRSARTWRHRSAARQETGAAHAIVAKVGGGNLWLR